MPTALSTKKREAPADSYEREQTEVEIEIDGKAISLQAPTMLIDLLDNDELEKVVSKTRNIIKLGRGTNEKVDETRIFRQQIDVFLNQREFEKGYELYRQVCIKFRVKEVHQIDYFRASSRYNPMRNRSRLSALAQIAAHVMEQGWELGTTVESKKPPHKRFVIMGMNRILNMELSGTTKTAYPLDFRTPSKSR